MPNLDFYAVDDDQSAVLNAVFEGGRFRVFEAYSEPGSQLREFANAQEISAAPHGPHLMLYTVGAGPEPMAHRIELRPGAAATFRYRCEGWGLIQLLFGNVFKGDELRWSHTNHNTAKRAAKLFHAYPGIGDPAECDWPTVTKASSRLNRIIRSMAISKIGSHPVLPHAAELISRVGLKHEYGAGMHFAPSPGMSSSLDREVAR